MKMTEVKFRDLKNGDKFWYSKESSGNPNLERIKTSNNIFVKRTEIIAESIDDDDIVYVYRDSHPELSAGFYYLERKNGKDWLHGKYLGIVNERYAFEQDKSPSIFTINPENWHINKIAVERVEK